ncbi:hypothetical protein TYRP_015636 [Tyrophagus putrescentiae]|nr:hypothetical protein TYRP_015636 [Tyrophagus putrescentiae]
MSISRPSFLLSACWRASSSASWRCSSVSFVWYSVRRVISSSVSSTSSKSRYLASSRFSASFALLSESRSSSSERRPSSKLFSSSSSERQRVLEQRKKGLAAFRRAGGGELFHQRRLQRPRLLADDRKRVGVEVLKDETLQQEEEVGEGELVVGGVGGQLAEHRRVEAKVQRLIDDQRLEQAGNERRLVEGLQLLEGEVVGGLGGQVVLHGAGVVAAGEEEDHRDGRPVGVLLQEGDQRQQRLLVYRLKVEDEEDQRGRRRRRRRRDDDFLSLPLAELLLSNHSSITSSTDMFFQWPPSRSFSSQTSSLIRPLKSAWRRALMLARLKEFRQRRRTYLPKKADVSSSSFVSINAHCSRNSSCRSQSSTGSKEFAAEEEEESFSAAAAAVVAAATTVCCLLFRPRPPLAAAAAGGFTTVAPVFSGMCTSQQAALSSSIFRGLRSSLLEFFSISKKKLSQCPILIITPTTTTATIPVLSPLL